MVKFASRIIKIFCVLGLVWGNNGVVAKVPHKKFPKSYEKDKDVPIIKKRSGPITFAEIGELLISSYGFVPNQSNIARPIDSYGMPLLTIQEQRNLVFSILSNLDKVKRTPCDDYRSHAIRCLLGDLEIFYSKSDGNHDNHLFSHFDYTYTLFGQAVLAKMLADPLTNSNTLRGRQSFIKALCEDEQLFAQVEKLVRTMKESEPSILSFWVEQESSTRALIETLYWDIPKWDRNAKKLEVAARLQFLWQARPVVEDVFVSAALRHLANILFMKGITGGQNEKYNTSFVTALKQSVEDVVPLKEIGDSVRLYKGSMSIEDYCKEQNIRADFNASNEKELWLNELGPRYRAIGYSGVNFAGKLYLLSRRIESIKDSYAQIIRLRDTLNGLQTRLIKVADFMEGVTHLKELATNYPVIVSGLLSFNTVQQLSSNAYGSTDFRMVLDLLRTSTFKGEASFFSYSGRVLKANKLMQKTKSELSSVLYAYGEVAACLSIAHLVKTHQAERVGYCFVEYSDNTTPYFSLKDFWNPQVDPTIVVTNSLELGLPEKARNVILTGSNTGGKSTLIKAMAMSSLMAQTWTIAPAKSMMLTPFHYIGSSMNIVDNTAEGISLLKAEADRAAALVKAAALGEMESKPCILFIDELFRGTGPEVASQETYKTAKNLALGKNTLFVLATHFVTDPTRLEQETNGICKNYKVEAYLNEYGEVVRPFKLTEGINQNNIASAIFGNALAAQS